MIQANELRIGNWLNHNGKNLQVLTIDTQGDGSFAGVLAIEYSENDWYRMTTSYDGVLKPIPLTPEILEAAGFNEIRNKSGIFDKGILRIAVSISAAFVIQDEQVISLRILINHLHQLQNLYYSLTGKELEIKSLNPA